MVMLKWRAEAFTLPKSVLICSMHRYCSSCACKSIYPQEALVFLTGSSTEGLGSQMDDICHKNLLYNYLFTVILSFLISCIDYNLCSWQQLSLNDPKESSQMVTYKELSWKRSIQSLSCLDISNYLHWFKFCHTLDTKWWNKPVPGRKWWMQSLTSQLSYPATQDPNFRCSDLT